MEKMRKLATGLMSMLPAGGTAPVFLYYAGYV